MKLVRYGPRSRERSGVIDNDGRIRDLSERLGPDGDVLGPEGQERVRNLALASLPVVEGTPRLGPCVARVGKIVGVGLNYRRHALEAGAEVPSEPVLFSKAVTALGGPHDDVTLPAHAVKVDWEVELAVVIGQRANDIAEEDAFDVIAGYSIMNDVSDRALQLEGTGQWLKGKSLDGFAPLGPWLVTPDEIPDPQTLPLWLRVNDHLMQDSSTADMVFPVRHLISYISRHMTLVPGDVIATGTPQGVGMGQQPPRYLNEGDVMHLGIEGLGEQRQVVRRSA